MIICFFLPVFLLRIHEVSQHLLAYIHILIRSLRDFTVGLWQSSLPGAPRVLSDCLMNFFKTILLVIHQPSIACSVASAPFFIVFSPRLANFVKLWHSNFLWYVLLQKLLVLMTSQNWDIRWRKGSTRQPARRGNPLAMLWPSLSTHLITAPARDAVKPQPGLISQRSL